MRRYFTFKAPQELIDDDTSFEHYLKHNFGYHLHKLMKESIKPVSPYKFMMAYNGTDFVDNRQTVRIEFNAFKVPRILNKRHQQRLF